MADHKRKKLDAAIWYAAIWYGQYLHVQCIEHTRGHGVYVMWPYNEIYLITKPTVWSSAWCLFIFIFTFSEFIFLISLLSKSVDSIKRLHFRHLIFLRPFPPTSKSWDLTLNSSCDYNNIQSIIGLIVPN